MAKRWLPLTILMIATIETGPAWAAPNTSREQPSVCQMPQAPGDRPPVCMDAFYDVLVDHGAWLATDRFGTLFCPSPTSFGPDFRPFAKGHWAMGEEGWIFVGDHPMSWVTDHYGRWVETGIQGCAWGWVPGEVWSPAWVEFRVGEKVVAWRPARFDGIPVQLRVPPGVSLTRVQVAPPPFSADDGVVAVQDNDFKANRLEDVALSGPELYEAIKDTTHLPDVRAGLHSQTRYALVERMLEAREAHAAAAVREPESGEPPEPARRRGAGAGPGRRGPGVAATVRTGARGNEGKTPQPGQNPPGSGKVYWGGDQNQGGFNQGGPPGGVKVLEWGKPKPKNPPAQVPPQGGTP